MLTITYGRVCFGQQSRFAVRNARYMDSVRQLFDSLICKEGLDYPKEYGKNEIKEIESVIHVVNFFLNHDLSEDRIDSVTSGLQLDNIHVRKSRVKNGLLHEIKLEVKTRLLYSELTFEFAGNFLVSRNFTLRPDMNVRCGKDGFRYVDLKLVDTLYARQIDYPITLMYWHDILLKKTDRNNLVRAAHAYPDYRFGLDRFGAASGKDEWIAGFLRNQFDPDSVCYYSHELADKHFVELIRTGNFTLIRDLLFSPNYGYAINAMEAMIYLSQTGQVTLANSELACIEALKKDDSRIVEERSDVEYNIDGYKALDKVSTDDIVRKYKYAIR